MMQCKMSLDKCSKRHTNLIKIIHYLFNTFDGCSLLNKHEKVKGGLLHLRGGVLVSLRVETDEGKHRFLQKRLRNENPVSESMPYTVLEAVNL